MKTLLLTLTFLLTACVGTSVTSKGFKTNANATYVAYKGSDGSMLTMYNLDHSTPMSEMSKAITARGNAVGGIVGALGASALLK